MERYDQVEMDDEYDDWVDFMEEVCMAQEENTAVDVSMVMGYDLFTPDPSVSYVHKAVPFSPAHM